MATNVKFSTGLQDDLLKLNSDKTYVKKIENGHIYFVTRENDDGETVGSIFYDVGGKRVSMGGGIAEQAKADDMKQNIADTYIKRISSEGKTYADTDGVTVTTYNGRGAALETILLPVAGTDRAGTVITGAQTFAGNKTFNNDLTVKGIFNFSGIKEINQALGHAAAPDQFYNADARPLWMASPSGYGTPVFAEEIAYDPTTCTLHVMKIDQVTTTTVTADNVNATNLTGHLTGTMTGNVTGHASLDLPLKGGTMTGTIHRAYTASNQTPMISFVSPNFDNALFQVGSSSINDAGFSLFYRGEGSGLDNRLTFYAHGYNTGTTGNKAVNALTIRQDGHIGILCDPVADYALKVNGSVFATAFKGNADSATNATNDESGHNIKATYAAQLQNNAHDGSGYTFRLLNKNGGALTAALTIPGATDEKSGLVTTGEQTWAGKKTLTGQVIIQNTSDAGKGTANSGALIIGAPTGSHIAIDNNEIMAKSSGTASGTLYVQNEGGAVHFGGNILASTDDAQSIGSSTVYWKDAYINEIYGHLNGSLTGTVKGNADSASKWLTARKVTMTGDVTGNFTIDGSQDVSFKASIGNNSIMPVKLAVVDYDNLSHLNRFTASYYGFTADTTSSSEGTIYTVNNIKRDQWLGEEVPCTGGEKLLITYEISTSVMGNTSSGGTDSSYRGTAVGIYGFQKAGRQTSAGIVYATRTTATAAAPWVKVSSIVTVPAGARYFTPFLQTESYGNFSGTLKIRNLEIRRPGGVLDAKGDEILPKYITKLDFNQGSEKLDVRLYDGNNAVKATVQVPNASKTNNGIITTGTQEFAGAKTFTTSITVSAANGFTYSGIGAGSDNADRPVWFSYNGIVGRPVYDNDFKYNPSTNTLKVVNVQGLASHATADKGGKDIRDNYFTNVTFTQDTDDNSIKHLNINMHNGDNKIVVTTLVPNAAADAAGVVNTGTQTFAGKKTFSGQVIITGGTDVAKATAKSGQLIVGNVEGEHIVIDSNEIMGKASGTTVRNLLFQWDGGNVAIGGHLYAKTTDTQDLGQETLRWRNIYAKNIVADTLSGNLTGNVTGNLTGNASSATKLLNKRKIILGNDLQGEVEFDGTANVTFTGRSYSCTVDSGNKANYPWHRIATLANQTSSYTNKDMVIAIRHTYNGGGYGIAKISFRTNDTANGATASANIQWLVRYNISRDNLQVALNNTAKASYADVYYKVGTYAHCRVYQLQGDRTWTLKGSNEVNNTTTTDKLTSTECYETIAAAGTALSRTYTSITPATDEGIVGKAYGDESGFNIKASYLARLKQVTSSGTAFTFRGVNKNGADMADLISIPEADEDTAGLVTVNAQKWTGNKTFTGRVYINNTTDANGATKESGGLIIGDKDGNHVVIDGNEVMAKASGTTMGTLYLNAGGGALVFGAAATARGSIIPDAQQAYVLGDNAHQWLEVRTKNAYVANLLYVNQSGVGSSGGIGLYSTSAPTDYGIAMRNNLGSYAWTTGDWNTYFSMTGGSTRGWIFRNGGTAIASLNGQGYLYINKLGLNRKNGTANGRISWYNHDWYNWFDYMSNVGDGLAPTGGKPSVLGEVTTWALRRVIEQQASYGWIWESTSTTTTAASATTTPTARMALSSADGRLYLTNDLNILSNQKSRFVHYRYNEAANADTTDLSWRAGVTPNATNGTNLDYVIQTGKTASNTQTWYDVMRMNHADYYVSFGQSNKGGIGIRQTNGAGAGLSLYNGGYSGKPTYGIAFAQTGSSGFAKHGYVQGDWATYFTMNSSANRGWVFLKDSTAVASISNDGKANFAETTIRNQLILQDSLYRAYNATGQTPMIWMNGADYDNNLFTISSGTANGNTYYGYYLRYRGSGSGVSNLLTLYADNQANTTTKKIVWSANQNGQLGLNADPNTSYQLYITGNEYFDGTLDVTGIAKFKQGSASTSATTGALRVSGGIGVSANSWFGGTITAVGNVKAPRFEGIANSADWVNTNSKLTYGASGLNYFNLNGTAGTTPNANVTPTSAWYHIIRLNHANGNGYFADIAIPLNDTGGVYWRQVRAGTNYGWYKLIDSNNMFGELDGRYVNITGDTMTGLLTANGGINSTSINAGILRLRSNYSGWASNYCEGLRLQSADSTWATIILGATADTGTNTYAWSIHRKSDNNFCISRGSSDGANGLLIDTSGRVGIGTVTPSEKLTVNGWVGTIGATGWYSITYGGGIYMTDSTWVRTYNTKKFYVSSTASDAIYTAGGVTLQSNKQFVRAGYSSSWIAGRSNAMIRMTSISGYSPFASIKTTDGSWEIGVYDLSSYTNDLVFTYCTDANFNAGTNSVSGQLRMLENGVVTNAIWNDYAEYRHVLGKKKPGSVVCENGNDELETSTERLQPAASVISDTYGMCIGSTETQNTPLAVSGRVMVYPYQLRENYKVGDCVCAAPGGTADIMTQEEIQKYPDRILGVVTGVPNYDIWTPGNIKVNGRIWIKVR